MKYFGVFLLTLALMQCTNQNKQVPHSYSEQELITYRESGLETALATKAALGSVLIPTVTQKGTIEALEFCHIKAIPLTDSVSTESNRRVYRVSDKPRNPDNQANDLELDYILSTKEKIANGEMATPEVQIFNDKVIGYYPIITNQFCLQCHGNPGKEITNETFSAIQELYPEDKAIGYGDGELRGIFVIEMEGKSNN